jgi:outer membrane protein assembly factor BamA
MLRNITPNAVSEKLMGGAVGAGVLTMARNPILNNTQIRGNIGIDNINYERQPKASLFNPTEAAQFQIILDKEFVPGKFFWFAQYLEQDTRNHPVHVSRGHRAIISSKIAAPTFGDNIGFYKLTVDASWYTPIINEYDLVFKFHVFLGWLTSIGNNLIPFGELFHIGGPSSVRGFLFGQIGPKFATDSIGAQKALFWNAELMFPITADMNMKGALFYDGGAGFDNPYVTTANRCYITDNNFDYRHAVGVGLRMLSPMPVKIDWGFKIDPRSGESAYEVHFGMTYDW